jgi:D-amino-acid dehydrogenase
VAQVIIVGAGVVGLASAWYLRQAGWGVTVVDRAGAPGEETSYANGALITPSMCEPWNAPGSVGKLFASMWQRDAALQLRLRAVPGLWRWGFQFLANSRPALFEANAASNLTLALSSRSALEELVDELGIACDFKPSGSLRVFQSHNALNAALARAEALRHRGLKSELVAIEALAAREPALAARVGSLKGALFYSSDAVADAFRFCTGLAGRLRDAGVRFRFKCPVAEIELQAGRVQALRADGGRLVADQFVIAAGSWSTPLLRTIGLRLPVYPVKGYSLTLSPCEDGIAPRVPIVDDQLHAVAVPLAKLVRIAATAEFDGYDRHVPIVRSGTMEELAAKMLPNLRFHPVSGGAWCGLRAMSADGVPLIGRTPVANLFLNTGHGHLGWTMAAGAGALLRDLMLDAAPAFDPEPYLPRRFSSLRG